MVGEAGRGVEQQTVATGAGKDSGPPASRIDWRTLSRTPWFWISTALVVAGVILAYVGLVLPPICYGGGWFCIPIRPELVLAFLTFLLALIAFFVARAAPRLAWNRAPDLFLLCAIGFGLALVGFVVLPALSVLNDRTCPDASCRFPDLTLAVMLTASGGAFLLSVVLALDQQNQERRRLGRLPGPGLTYLGLVGLSLILIGLWGMYTWTMFALPQRVGLLQLLLLAAAVLSLAGGILLYARDRQVRLRLESRHPRILAGPEVRSPREPLSLQAEAGAGAPPPTPQSVDIATNAALPTRSSRRRAIRPLTLIVIGLVAASAILLSLGATRALVWGVSQVADQARSPSLALDAAGVPHLAYIAENAAELKYATRTGGSWSIETADTGRYEGDFAASTLALDAEGRPYIVYSDTGSASVKVAHRTDAGWSVEAVGESGYFHSTLALDSAGRPAVAYQKGCTETDNKSCSSLSYAHWTGTVWDHEIVDAPSQDMTGLGSSMTFDSQDRPHIAYVDFAGYNSTLRHAVRTGTEWHVDTVATANFADDNLALALDASDRPHIAYTQWDITVGSTYPLQYATYSGTSWTVETADHSLSILDTGSRVDLAFDASGRAGISYSSHGLKYASQRGGAWAIESVDLWAPWTGTSSLAVEASGARDVVYATGICGWMSGCVERTVMYAHAGSPESAEALTWALGIAGLAAGVVAVVVFVRGRRRRAQRSERTPRRPASAGPGEATRRNAP